MLTDKEQKKILEAMSELGGAVSLLARVKGTRDMVARQAAGCAYVALLRMKEAGIVLPGELRELLE